MLHFRHQMLPEFFQCVTEKRSELQFARFRSQKCLSFEPICAVCSTRVRHSARQICSLEKQRNAAWANLLSGGAQWAHTHTFIYTYIYTEKILQLSQQQRASIKKMHLLPPLLLCVLCTLCSSSGAGHTVWKAWCGFFPPSAQNTWLKGQHSCAVTSY